MARTGTQFAKLTGDYSSINVYATWQLRSQDKTAKTSTIRLREYLTYSSNGTYGSSYSIFKLNDKEVKSGAYSYSGSGDYLQGYTDIVVEHNEDGTFPDTILKAYVSSYHFTNKPSKTATLTSKDIPSIEVNSTIDDVVTYSTDSELGVPTAVQLTSNIVDSTSKLYLVVDEVEHLIFEETVNYIKLSVIFFDEDAYTTSGDLKTPDGAIIEKYLSPVTWQDICALIPNDTSKELTFRLKTYIDGVEKGVSESIYNFEVTKANISYTYSFENDDLSYDLVGNKNTMILNASKPTFTINNAISKNGATISKYRFLKMTDSEEWYTITSSSKTFTKPTLLKDTYLCQIFDSRGFFVDTPYLSIGDDFYDVLIPYIEYTKPIFDKVQIARPDEVANYVNLSITGSFWNKSFGAKTNVLTVQYRYKLSNSSAYTDWITVTNTPSTDGTFSCNATIQNISNELSATFEVRLVDSTEIEEKLIGIAVSKGKSMFDWGEEYFSFNGDFCINDEQVPCFKETSTNSDGSRNVQLYDYEGKKINIDDKNVVTIIPSTSRTISETTMVGINCDEEITVGEKLSAVENEDGVYTSIMIMADSGVSVVKVSGQVYISASLEEGDRISLHLYKNYGLDGEYQIANAQTTVSKTLTSIAITPILANASDGDEFTLLVRNRTSGTGTIYPNGTYLTVEVVK